MLVSVVILSSICGNNWWGKGDFVELKVREW